MTPPGAPEETTTATTPPAAQTPAPPVPTPAAVTPEQPTEQETTAAPELPFSLDDIGDDFTLTGPQAREWIIARQAQLQAPVTRTQQELAAQRQAEQEWLTLRDAIESPETRDATLRDFLGKYGIELEEEDGEEQPPAAVTPPPADDDDPALKRIAELEAREAARLEAQQEAREAQEREESATAAQRRVDEHTIASLDAYASSVNKDWKAEDIPADDRADVIRRAATLARRPDGLPDFDTAIAQHLDYRRQVAEAYAASKAAPQVGSTGVSGTEKADLTTPEARRTRALAIAERHYATP